MGQRHFCFRQALTAASADAEITGKVAHAGRAGFHGVTDVAVRNGFTDANDHVVYCERECE
jgi:hypothetical protein